MLFSTIFYNLILDFCVITRTRFFLRDKRLFEITEVEITRVDCSLYLHKISVRVLFSRTLHLLINSSIAKRFFFFFLFAQAFCMFFSLVDWITWAKSFAAKIDSSTFLVKT